MRQSTHQVGILRNKSRVLGFALGFDFCGEHQTGIPELSKALGLPHPQSSDRLLDCSPKPGATESRIAYKDYPSPSKTAAEETRLVVSSNSDHLERIRIPRNSRSWDIPIRLGEKPIAVAWNQHGFFIRCFSSEARDALKELHQAILEDDFVLSLGRGNPNTRGGLNLLIKSRLEEHREQRY